MRALLVDDDRELARLLLEYLTPHGVELVHVENGKDGLERLAKASTPVVGDRAVALGGAAFDVVLLDVMLPGMDGFEVCRELRKRFDVPVLMLTARGDDTDRIVGLELGADDYVPKPFNPRELLARMRAVLRRARPAPATAATEHLVVGDLEIDVPAHRVKVDGKEVSLTSFELRVLVALARRAGETVRREELAGAVHEGGEYDPSVDRSLDVHVSHLRQKIGDEAREPKKIRTVRGVGYCLVKPS